MSLVKGTLDGSHKRTCSLCGGFGWQHLGEGECRHCPRCHGTGIPARTAAYRILEASRGLYALEDVIRMCERLAMAGPSQETDFYQAGWQDGENSALAALAVILTRISKTM